METDTTNANSPDTINIVSVFTQDATPLTRKDAIGMDATLTAVAIPEILARYSLLILFTLNTFRCAFTNATV